MFYRPEDGHGLPHNPFNAIVTPRPIGWIGTRAEDGRRNLAPYSFFNVVADTDVTVIPVSLADLDSAMQQSPTLAIHLVTVMVRSMARRVGRWR